MPTDPGAEEVLDLVAKRIDVLRLLDGQRLPKRTIATELGCSRSTVNRATAALADAGLVDDAPRGCRTTRVGSLLADHYDEYVRTATDMLASHKLLASLSLDVPLTPGVLAAAEVSTPEGSSPYEPFYTVESLLERAVGAVRVSVATFTNPRGIELAGELSKRTEVEMVFDDGLLAELWADIPDDVEALFEQEGFTGYETTDGPEDTLILVDTESGTEGAIVVYSPARELVGCLVTSDPDTIRWLERRYAEIRAESDPVETPSDP